MIRSQSTAVVIAALATLATLVAPVTQADEALLIRNATVHTGVTGAAPQAATDVLVQGGKITALGKGLAAPAPGIFGGLTRIGLEEIGLDSGNGDHSQRLGQMRPEFDVTQAWNPDAQSLVVHRMNGVTFTVLTPGSAAGGSIVAGQGAPASLAGREALAPRAMFIDLGGDANDLSGGSRAAQFMLLRQALVEARAPNLVMVHDERLLSPSGRQVLLEFLKGGGVFVFDVDRAVDIRRTIEFAQQEKMRVAIRGGAEAWRVAPQLAAARIPVMIDPLENLPSSFDAVGATMYNAARLHAAGVTVVISMRSPDIDDAGKTRQAAGNAVAHGLPWAAGLAAITRVPAEIFGVGDRFGTLAPGRTADLVLWSGDPLEVSSVADLVLADGQVQSGVSRHTLLRDRYLERVRRGEAR
ncbi:MAG: amidohydrolase family protein [Xanthomonadales bacterium]|nr:amidohydrolase family protein [Xanthomonadales bacterium]